MRDMQAERLDNTRGLLLEPARHRFKGVRRKQLSGILQRRDIIIAFCDILRRDLRIVRIFLLHCRKHFLPRLILINCDHIIGKRIDGMHRAGADIQHDIVSAELILVNHSVSPFSSLRKRRISVFIRSASST